MRIFSLFLGPLLGLILFSSQASAALIFEKNQIDLVLATFCNHSSQSIAYTLRDDSFDESLITVRSDAFWAIPSVNRDLNRIDIRFDTESLIASYSATITVNDGTSETELFVNSNVRPLDIYRLIDDPMRSRTYGIQRDGINKGGVVSFDPKPLQTKYLQLVE